MLLLELHFRIIVRVRVKGLPRFRPSGVGLDLRVIVRVRVVGLLLELEFRVIVRVRVRGYC